MKRIKAAAEDLFTDKIYLVLIFLLFFLWLPSFFEPISYGDECIYLTLGQAFRRGLVFYRDIHDNKPPILYLIAALSFGKLIYLRFYNFLWNFIHLTIIYLLAKSLTKNKLVILLSLVGFLLLFILFEGRVANGETFMMMPVTLAAYLLLKKRIFVNKYIFGLIVGFLFSFGFLVKIPVIFDFFGITLAYFFFPIKKLNTKNILNILKNKILLGALAGFSLPILLSIIYYGSKGAFTPYVRSALFQNIGYLSSWQGSSLGLFFRFFLLIFFCLVVFLKRKEIPAKMMLISVWFLFSLFGALLSARPYPHYLIEVVPSLTLLLVAGLGKKSNNYLVIAPLVAIILTIISFGYYHFWYYPQSKYYKNFFNLVSKKISSEEYLSFWGQRVKDNYSLAQFVQETVLPQERIFVWGDAACVYATSKRLPPGRFTVNYHIFDFNGYKETLEAIQKENPKIIIKMENESRQWPELDFLLQSKYVPLKLPEIKLPEIKDQIFLLQEEQAAVKW
ncbi:MAG: hypothetical protein ABIB61_03910 [Candidatus Shapirobacteria bacterium]